METVPPARANGTASDATALTSPTPLFPQIHHAKQRAVLLAYAHSLQLTASCATAGVDRQLHYYWLKHTPGYAEAFATAKQLGVDWLEDVAIQRATAGERPSDVLLIFLLKGARPDKYRDTQRREDSREISELLKAVLLEMHERSQTRDVTPEADWAPRPPLTRPARPPLPPPPDIDEELPPGR